MWKKWLQSYRVLADIFFWKVSIIILYCLYLASCSLLELMGCKVSCATVAFDGTGFTEQRRRLCPSSKSLHCIDSNPINKKKEISRSNAHLSKGSWLFSRQPSSNAHPRKHPVLCYSMGSQSNEARECTRNSEDCKNLSRYVVIPNMHISQYMN